MQHNFAARFGNNCFHQNFSWPTSSCFHFPPLHDDPPWRTPLMLPLAAAVVAIVSRCCCCCSVSCGRRYIIRNLHKINKLNMPDMRCAVGRQFWPKLRFARLRLDSQSFHFVITRAWDSANHGEGGGWTGGGQPIDNVPKQLHHQQQQ